MGGGASPAARLAWVARELRAARERFTVNGLPWPPSLEAAFLLATGGQERPEIAVGEAEADALQVMTYQQAGARLGISGRTVRRLCTSGELATVTVAGSPRIRRADLDAYVSALPARGRRSRTNEKEEAVNVNRTRPPRPRIIPPALLDYASKMTSTRRSDIEDVIETDAGIIVHFPDGRANIVVPDSKPDALGQTGALFYSTPTHPKPPRNAKVYVAPESVGSLEPWTIEDLAYAASKHRVDRAPEDRHPKFGPSRIGWVDGDPVKAYARLMHLARSHDGNLKAAVYYKPEAAECRRIILESGWLAASEAAKL